MSDKKDDPAVSESKREPLSQPNQALLKDIVEEHRHHEPLGSQLHINSRNEGSSDEKADPEIRVRLSDPNDIEAGIISVRQISTEINRDVTEPDLVGWEGPDDPQNPRNWSSQRKWVTTLVVSSFTFLTPVASAIVAPAFSAIGADFHVCLHAFPPHYAHFIDMIKITSDIELSLMLSIFIVAYAVGPLFLAPLSEMYGRVVVLQLTNLVFLGFNLGCGLATSQSQMLAFRFLSGLGGSAPLVIGGGVISDLFNSDERGKAVSMYSLAPLLGPAIGPIAGGFMVEKTSWRWLFHVITITCAFVQAIGFALLQETYPPVLLRRKRVALSQETGNVGLFTEFDHPDGGFWRALRTSITRPFILIGTQPIIQVLAVYAAYLFGLMYLLLSTYPKLWETRYDESVGIAGLNYISLGLGFFLGTRICAPLQDRIFCTLKARNHGVDKPEFRVPLMFPASFMVPIGLFWYGWAAQAHTHWIVPNLGITVAAAGIYLGFLCIQMYIVDSYTRYAASALAATVVLRSLAGFGLPLFAPYMYNALDYGWGNSVLGFAAIGLGWPAPFLLWKYGERLRSVSTFASGS